MTRSPGYCGVILAAGTAERLSKSLCPWPEGNPLGSTLLSCHIDALNAVSELVLVVAGSNEAALTPTIYAHGGYVVSAAETAHGDFATVRVGLSEVLSRGRDTAIIASVDVPPVSLSSYRALCAAYQESPREIWAVSSTQSGAYTLIAGRELIEQILRAPAESTLNDVLAANSAHILAVDSGHAPGTNTEQLTTQR